MPASTYLMSVKLCICGFLAAPDFPNGGVILLTVPGLRRREKFGDLLPSNFFWNGSYYVITGRLFAWYNGKWTPAPLVGQGPASLPVGTMTAQVPFPYKYYEFCADDVFPHTRGKSGKFANGGPFTKIRVDTSGYSDLQGIGTYDSYNMTSFPGMGYCYTRYVGGFTSPSFPSPKWDNVAFSYGDTEKLLGTNFLVPSDLTSKWGPEAWARAAPKIQMADGFVFLSEGRELPSQLRDQAKRFRDEWSSLSRRAGLPGLAEKGRDNIPWRQQPKAVSDEYLSQQFGWAPFLRDLDKFYKAYLNTDEYMRRMSDGNDQWKHVRRVLLDDFQETKIYSGDYTWALKPYGYPFPDGFLRPGQRVTFTLTEEKSQIVSCSGMFKWYKPEFDATNHGSFGYDSLMSRISRQMTMYGVRVNPANIWRATPWSWLIDWQLNIGRNLDRLTEYVEDGVVCKYLYLMHHTVKRQVLKIYLPVKQGDVSLQFVNYVDVKLRREADSPFGFGSPWESLSPWRLSILAALGISKPTRVGFH